MTTLRVRSMVLWLSVVSATAAAQAPVMFEGVPDVVVEYYDVPGRSIAALRAAIDKVRPTDPIDKQRVDALASYDFRWRWRWRVAEGCRMEGVVVERTLKVLLPRPAERDRLPKADARRWDEYMAALRAHEAGHLRIADRRDDLIAAIQAADCKTADAAGNRVLAEIAAASAAYDRRTRHGRVADPS